VTAAAEEASRKKIASEEKELFSGRDFLGTRRDHETGEAVTEHAAHAVDQANPTGARPDHETVETVTEHATHALDEAHPKTETEGQESIMNVPFSPEEESRLHSEKLVVGIVVALLFVVIVGVFIYCFLRRQREKKPTISLHFRNASFRRGRIRSCGEELKDVSVESLTSAAKGGHLNELHNPIFSPALLHASASSQDIYKAYDWAHSTLLGDPKMKRSMTNPDFDCSSTSTPALHHGGGGGGGGHPRRAFTIDSQKSDDVSRSDSAFATGSTPPLQSSTDEEEDDVGDARSLGNYGDTEQLLP
jgi:hypothetical protein